MKPRLLNKLTRLAKDRSGGVLIYAALIAPVVLGAAGLSVDIGMWYANKRLAQSAADSAAMAAALESLRSNGDFDEIEEAAKLDADNHGYSTTEGDLIEVMPLGGTKIEVKITRQTPGFLSQVIFPNQQAVQARAVARAVTIDSCIWGLNTSEPETISVSGSAEVELACGMLANSGNPAALHKEGSGCLSASEFKVAGGYNDTNNSGCALSPAPETSVPPADDPLAALQAPPDPDPGTTCSGGGSDNYSTGDVTIPAGKHCKTIKITTSGTVTFAPGLHYFDGAGLEISSSSTIEGTDVSFYFNEDGGVNDGIDISGGADVTLSAPTNGPLPGILIYQDRDTTANITHKLTGGSNMQLDGIIYAPSTDVEFAGGTSADSSSIMIIADQVNFKGGDTFVGDFDTSSILSNPLLIRPQLLE